MLPCASRPAVILHCVTGWKHAVQHVLLARPDQLDRRARHLLGDQHRLAHPVVVAPRRPKPPPSSSCRPRTSLPAGRRPRRWRPAPPRRSAWASRPRSARRPARGGVHRLHRGVVLVRVAVDRLDLAGAAAIAAPRVAVLVADHGLRARPGRPSAPGRTPRGAALACGPSSHSIGSASSAGLGAPPGVGDHGHRAVADRTTLLHAGRFSITAASKLLTLPPNTGQSLMAAFSMPGSLRSMP
jgi:hypothetical protein